MKTLNVKIETCSDCPYCHIYDAGQGEEPWCNHMDGALMDEKAKSILIHRTGFIRLVYCLMTTPRLFIKK